VAYSECLVVIIEKYEAKMEPMLDAYLEKMETNSGEQKFVTVSISDLQTVVTSCIKAQ
jgi:hypothetical protein